MSKNRILLHVTGSISCFKAAQLASNLIKDGYEVRVTASDGAREFVGDATFEGITGKPVLRDIFGGKPDMTPHITLAEESSLIIVYPASANCINRLACGLSDDLFGALFLANNFRKPVLIAPAMNSNMFAHPAVRESLEKLKRWGSVILPTGTGRMACGTVGEGRLIEPDEAHSRISEYFG